MFQNQADSRSSIELLIGNSFKEAPNSLIGPSLKMWITLFSECFTLCVISVCILVGYI